MKGIILAAGKGTRLYPMTYPVPKPLLPVYDKPLIYYPLSILIQLGIDDILIIVPPGQERLFKNLLGDGSKLGISIKYETQLIPKGIADAFIVGEEFIGSDPVVLILGDNVFSNLDIGSEVHPNFNLHRKNNPDSAMILGYKVRDPWRFGVVEFNSEGKVLSLEEKPMQPKSNYIVPGFYYYPNDVIAKAKQVEPSSRGEIEITSINEMYLKEDKLYVDVLPEDSIWFDAGNADSLLEVSKVVCDMKRLGIEYEPGIIEIQSYTSGFIDEEQLLDLGRALKFTNYGASIIDYCNLFTKKQSEIS